MRCIAMGLALAMGLATATPAEDNFTAGDVLGWERDSQDWYFEVSVGMAAALASQNESAAATCINDWYFGSEKARQDRNAYFREIMGRFERYHPVLVMISAIEKECGTLTFK